MLHLENIHTSYASSYGLQGVTLHVARGSGEQQMLSIARALLMNPQSLLMDEPSDGLAPLIVREVGKVIGQLKVEGMGVLLVEQNLPLRLSVADRCYVLNKGATVYEAPPHELHGNHVVKQRYPGV